MLRTDAPIPARVRLARRRHAVLVLNLALIVTLIAVWLSSGWLYFSLRDCRKSDYHINAYLGASRLTIMFPNPYWGGSDPGRWIEWRIGSFWLGVESVWNIPNWNPNNWGGLPGYRRDREGGANQLGIPIWCMIVLLVALHFVAIARRKLKRSSACQLCEYDLTGNVSGRCPECGAPIGTRQREDHL